MEYYSIRYVEGTQCDVQNLARESDIQFHCAPNVESSIITEIKEPSTCRYAIRIDTPLICKHPNFKQNLIQPEKIVCYPQNDLDSLLEGTQSLSDLTEDPTASNPSSANEQKSASPVENASPTKGIDDVTQTEKIRKRIQEQRRVLQEKEKEAKELNKDEL